MQERFFDDGTFPPLAEVRKAVAQAKKPDEQRPPPFAGKTQPFAHLSVVDYGNRLNDWLGALQREEEAPTTEQFELITRVKDRVLEEIRLESRDSPTQRPPRANSRRTAAARVVSWFPRNRQESGDQVDLQNVH